MRKDIAKYAQGITIVHLSFNNFCKIKVQIPSLEEQNSITDFIDSLNQQQKLITNKIKLLKERKKGFYKNVYLILIKPIMLIENTKNKLRASLTVK